MFSVKYRGKTYPVPSIEAAADKWCEFRDAAMAQGFGPDDIGNGLAVRDGADRIVARVAWNGRIWPITGKGNLWPRATVPA